MNTLAHPDIVIRSKETATNKPVHLSQLPAQCKGQKEAIYQIPNYSLRSEIEAFLGHVLQFHEQLGKARLMERRLMWA